MHTQKMQDCHEPISKCFNHSNTKPINERDKDKIVCNYFCLYASLLHQTTEGSNRIVPCYARKKTHPIPSVRGKETKFFFLITTKIGIKNCLL